MGFGERTADHARNAVLEVAEGLFARYGFKKTSIEDIARAARIGKGSVYLHFSSKEDLFGEVVRRVSDRMMSTLVEAVGSARTPAAKLRAFIRAHLNDVAALAAEYHLDEERLMELLPVPRAPTSTASSSPGRTSGASRGRSSRPSSRAAPSSRTSR